MMHKSTSVYHLQSKNVMSLTDELGEVNKWMARNHLKLNQSKTEVLLLKQNKNITANSIHCPLEFGLSLEFRQSLKLVTKAKSFGFFLDK